MGLAKPMAFACRAYSFVFEAKQKVTLAASAFPACSSAFAVTPTVRPVASACRACSSAFAEAKAAVSQILGDDCCIGIFIPGILPIWFLFAGLVGAGVFLVLDAALRRCVAGIFIPGIFIPGMLLMSCFLAGCLFRATLLFVGAAFRLAVDLAFGIFIPGMFCMS